MAVYLKHCVVSAIIGCKYILSGENAPDSLDNVCVLTPRQAATQKKDACEVSMANQKQLVMSVKVTH